MTPDTEIAITSSNKAILLEISHLTRNACAGEQKH
jgi:hypothetical protein